MNRIPEIFLVCPGVGHIYRGYETFARQCFDALKNESSFHMRLFKGAGSESEAETTIRILKRTAPMARAARVLRRSAYDAEQLSFALGLIPHLRQAKPELVFFRDQQLGWILLQWRRVSKQNFKLLFSNGGPAQLPFPQWDHIHQVSPEHYENAMRNGISAEMQTLIPDPCDIPRQQRTLSFDEKSSLRRRLRLPVDRPIIISVGMLSAFHKRMDYVIQEIHRLAEPRPYLLLLGQGVGSETENIRAMAEKLLGPGGYHMASVPPDQVQEHYWSSDVFVLASLTEGLPRVLVEAMAAGLPCLAHDYATTRYVVGTTGYLRDLRTPGALAAVVGEAIKNSDDMDARIARQRDAYERFSWERLAPEYARMLRRIALSSAAPRDQRAKAEHGERLENRDSDSYQRVYRMAPELTRESQVVHA